MIVQLVQQYLASDTSAFVALTEEETKLFRQVNAVPLPGIRERWRELKQRQQLGNLEPEQQTEMTELYGEIEANHVQRLTAAAELAKLRQVSLDEVLTQLGIVVGNND